MLWEAWRLSQAYSTRPSAIYGITSYLDAFSFDRAVYRFGSFVDAELEGVEGKNKREIESKRLRVMQKYLPKAQSASNYADPANRST